jgi:hypothetical protein
VPQVYEVLKEKQIAIEQLRQEIDALRLVCPLLHDDGDVDAANIESDDKSSDPTLEENTETGVSPDEKAACLARIRAQFTDAGQKSAVPAAGRNVLIQFRQAALGASRALLKRVPYSRSSNIEGQRRTIRGLFERLGRSNAA